MARFVKNLEQDQGASASPPTGPAPFGLSPASGSQAEPLVPSAGHTPGPWYVSRSDHGAAVCCDGGHSLAAVWPASLRGAKFDVDANARLIAAAPDMLGDLQVLIKAFGSCGHPLYERARATVAKALGSPVEGEG